MIYVITNRNVKNRSDEKAFGDDFNKQGQDIIRVAKASHIEDDSWHLDILQEEGTEPSRTVFEAMVTGEKPWVFFVHGFNQSLVKNLNKAREIEGYGVNVVCFSWPSNPGPQFIVLKGKEYKRARRNAHRSTIALTRTLEKFYDYNLHWPTDEMRPPATLVIHSLGNTLTQHVVNSADYEGETKMFRNIVLHQADAANNIHAQWVEQLAAESRVYITL